MFFFWFVFSLLVSQIVCGDESQASGPTDHLQSTSTIFKKQATFNPDTTMAETTMPAVNIHTAHAPAQEDCSCKRNSIDSTGTLMHHQGTRSPVNASSGLANNSRSPASTTVPVAEKSPATTKLPAAEGSSVTTEFPAASVTTNVPVTEGSSVTTNVPAAEGSPVTTEFPAGEGSSVTTTVPATERSPVTTTAPAAERSVTTAFPADEGSSVTTTVPAAEGSSVITTAPIAEGSSITTKFPVAERSSVTTNVPADSVTTNVPVTEGSSVTTNVPAAERSPVTTTAPADEGSSVTTTVPVAEGSSITTKFPVAEGSSDTTKGRPVKTKVPVTEMQKSTKITAVFLSAYKTAEQSENEVSNNHSTAKKERKWLPAAFPRRETAQGFNMISSAIILILAEMLRGTSNKRNTNDMKIIHKHLTCQQLKKKNTQPVEIMFWAARTIQVPKGRGYHHQKHKKSAKQQFFQRSKQK